MSEVNAATDNEESLPPMNIEMLKHKNALQLEDRKEQAAERIERLKDELARQREVVARQDRVREVRFLEAGEHMRALNAFMWQVPGIAIGVTGGLWYGASMVMDQSAKAAVLAFTAVADALLILVLWRVRFLFQRDLKVQLEYGGVEPSKGLVRYVVVAVWTALLLFAAVLSGAGALNPERVVQRQPRAALVLEQPDRAPPSPAPSRASEPPTKAVSGAK